MKIYSVEIIEVRSRVIEIEADDYESAESKVKEMHESEHPDCDMSTAMDISFWTEYQRFEKENEDD